MKKRELYNYLKTIAKLENYKIPAMKNFDFYYESFEGFTIVNTNDDISFKLVFDEYNKKFKLRIVDTTILKNKFFNIEKEFNIEDFN